MSEVDPMPASDAAPDDATLGGYFSVHDRPPAYDGPDGHPYTVSLEVEKTPNLSPNLFGLDQITLNS